MNFCFVKHTLGKGTEKLCVLLLFCCHQMFNLSVIMVMHVILHFIMADLSVLFHGDL